MELMRTAQLVTAAKARGWGSEDETVTAAAGLPPPSSLLPLQLGESEWADQSELALLRFQAAWRRRTPVVAVGIRPDTKWDPSDLIKRTRTPISAPPDEVRGLRAVLEEYIKGGDTELFRAFNAGSLAVASWELLWAAFPTHMADLIAAMPVPEYTHPSLGPFNLSALLPPQARLRAVCILAKARRLLSCRAAFFPFL